jgi:hypothetical protein
VVETDTFDLYRMSDRLLIAHAINRQITRNEAEKLVYS